MTRTITIWVLFLTLFALLTWFCIAHLAPSISHDISVRSQTALNEAGYTSVSVSHVDGLNVHLSGALLNTELGAAAVVLVEQVRGVRHVESAFDYGERVQVAEKQPSVQGATPVGGSSNPVSQRPNFSAAHDGKTINIRGTVTDVLTRASLIGAARRTFTDQRVVDELIEVADMPTNWGDQLKQGMTALALLKSGKLDISENYISLVGSAHTTQSKRGAEQRITQMASAEQRVRLDVAVLSANSVDATACQSALDRLLDNNTIHFNVGSDVISVDSYPLLEELADAIARCENVAVEVQGHTDSSGDAQVNRRLSELRALAVVSYLKDEGIEQSKLSAVGLGSTRPVGDNNTTQGRALNRRIEFVTTGT